MSNETNNDCFSDWENAVPSGQRASSRRRRSPAPFLALALAIAVGIVFFLLPKFRHEHVWIEATCTTSRVCADCGEVEGDPLGHNWKSATAVEPSSCFTCGLVNGRSLGYKLTWCTAIKDSNAQDTTKDVCTGDWRDTFGCGYEDALRFWVADFGDWNAEEYILYDLGSQFTEMEITIAPEENSEVNTRGKILIYSGTVLLYESNWISDATPPVYACVDVSGCDEIMVVCQTDSGDFHYSIVDAVLYN